MAYNQRKKTKTQQPVQKQLPQQVQCDSDEDIPQIVDLDLCEQNVQISTDQAERYLEYLRKKVTHQIKDPFSVPFLNLKFQQLNSWKCVTQQLNLQSRVYGLRVDNCHDGTIKLLNHLIRNQEQQIINESLKDNINSSEIQQEKKTHQKPCFHLQNSQKISIKPGINFDKQNNAIWRVIFKKCQNLSQFHLNCIELSQDFSLKLDRNDEDIQFFDDENLEQTKEIFDYKLPKTQNLFIFKDIQTQISQYFQQIFDLKARLKNNKSENQRQKEFADFGFNANNSINQDKYFFSNDDMLDYYSKLQNDQFQQNRPNDITNFPRQYNSDLNTEQKLFLNNNQNQHFQGNHVNFNEILQQIRLNYDSQNDSQSINLQERQKQQLYQPYNDMIYQTMRKKLSVKQNKHDNMFSLKQKRVKRQQQQENIHFNQFYQDKSLVLRSDQKQENYLKLNNLLPINLVTLYESRNPFKKLRYIRKSDRRLHPQKYQPKIKNIYESLPQQIIQINDSEMRLSCQNEFFTQFTQNQESYFIQNDNNHSLTLNQTFQYQAAPSQTNIHFRESKQKSLPLKFLKSQIKKELQYFSNQKNNTSKNSSFNSEIQIGRESQRIQNFKFQTETHVINQQLGLKYLRAKMKNVDPLDIFTAMLHVAYEQQIIIRLQKNSGQDKKVCDLIMEESA